MFGFKKKDSKGVDYISQKYGTEVPELNCYDSGYEYLYSIRDNVCSEYNPPFVCKNDLVCIRSLQDSFKGKQTMLTLHPEDYALWCLGTFDKNNGVVTPDSRLVLPIVDILAKLNKEITKDEVQK